MIIYPSLKLSRISIIKDILPGVTSPKECTYVIENRREAIRHAIDIAKEGDVVLLAGKGHEKYQIIGKTKYDFDESAIALAFMEELGK